MKATILLKASLLIILSLLCLRSNAQDVYLSISGQNVEFLSGDSRHQYDIWIKPSEGAPEATLQIYDAGLGGAVDLITNRTATTTTYSVYRFNDMYQYSGGQVSPSSENAQRLTELITSDEERYRNRWVPLSDLSSNTENGYLIRVSAGEGADVNNFNFRVVDQAGSNITSESWNIVTFDLSIGFYRSQPNNFFQLRPFLTDGEKQVKLTVDGEEDTELKKIDSFGNIYDLNETAIPATRFGTSNDWGLHMSGSNEIINNFTVYGEDSPVLWVYDPIFINEQQKPTITLSESIASKCTDFIFDLRSNELEALALREAKWLLQENQIGTGNQPTISFSKKGAVSFNVLIPNQDSYFPEYWNYEKEIFVNTPPVARLITPKEIISPGETITFSADGSYDTEGQELSYNWFVNGNQRGTGKTFDFTNTISGQYVVSVRVSDSGIYPKCSTSQRQSRIRVNTQPYVEMEFTPVFGTNESVVFRATNASDADNDPISFEWLGSGIVENNIGGAVQVRHNTPGFYDITLIAEDSSRATNSAYSITKQYEVNAAPELAFNIPEKVAPGDSIELDATPVQDKNDNDLAYQWFLNGNQIDSSRTTQLSLVTPGDYEIKLRANDRRQVSNSISELSKMLRVNDAPAPVIVSPDITSSSKVELKAVESDKINRYSWDFGDGNSASGSQVTHIFQKPGTYNITLTVDDGEGLANSIQTNQKKLIINKFPTSQFTLPDVVAPGDQFLADGSLSIDEDGMIESYSWYINGLPAATGEGANLMISQPGEHTVSLAVQDNSGFEIARGLTSKTIRVNEAPIPYWDITPAKPVPDSLITFSADDSYDPDGTIDQFVWTFSDGTTLEGPEVVHRFPESGTKQFSLSVSDNDNLSNSTTVAEGSVRLNHQPYIVTESFIRSNQLEVQLDASSSYDLDQNPIAFEWTLPDGSKRHESEFTWKASEPGIHIISLKVDDGLGLPNSINEEMIQVLINRPVKAVVDSLINSCTGQTVLFNSSRSYDPDGDAFQVNWDFGDGTSSDQANPSYSYDKAGIYEAELTMTDGFSLDKTIAKIPVIIEGSPIARMNVVDTTICVNSMLQFDGSASTDPSGSMPSFSWDLGDGNSATGVKVDHVFTEPGDYIVALTVEGSGSGMCSNISQTTARVRVIEGPEASFDIPEWSAPGEEIQLDASNSKAEGGFNTVQWLIENSDTTVVAEGLQSSYTFTDAGEYFVTLNLQTDTGTSCNQVSLTKSIKINAEPVIQWDLQEQIAAGTDLKLDATSSSDTDGYITSYQWMLNDSLISRNSSEIIKATEPGIHTVSLEVTDNSKASNRTVSIEKTFYANSSPSPVIEVPEQRYLHQLVTMESLNNIDVDGDQLDSSWYLDGKKIERPEFTPNEQRKYRMVLIQNDGRGLPNSIDSAAVEYIPKKLPEPSISIPEFVIKGAELTKQQLELEPGWEILSGNTYVDRWTAENVGSDSLTVAWVFENQELVRSSFPINVAELLRFTTLPEQISLSWNPANPTTILEAPSVNRDLNNVNYIWLKGDQIIGEGRQQEVTLEEGRNLFTVLVTDLKVEQSDSVKTEMEVITQ